MDRTIFIIYIVYVFLIGLAMAQTSCYWSYVDDSTFTPDNAQWCKKGYAITSLKLSTDDSGPNSPFIASARCCPIPSGFTGWTCEWREIGYDWSTHASENDYNSFCPPGTYMTAIDQDAGADVDEGNLPYIGRVKCCRPKGIEPYKHKAWVDIGWVPSFKKTDWCGDGFLVSFDLDGTDTGDSDTGSPIVGKCQCAS